MYTIDSVEVYQKVEATAWWAPFWFLIPLTLGSLLAEEGIGAGTELRSPCECESLVEFQGRTLGALESLTQNHILLGWRCGLQGG